MTCPKQKCKHEFSVKVKGPPRDADQLKAMQIAGQMGLTEKVDKDLIDELWHAVELNVSEEDLPAVKRAWNQIVGRRLVEAAT